jgi:hypothetical protein
MCAAGARGLAPDGILVGASVPPIADRAMTIVDVARYGRGPIMDLQRDAMRLATIATVFVWVGWIAVLYSFIAGILWWIDLAGRPAFSFIEAFAISASAIGGPLFLALIVAALGHALRLFALYVASKSQ